MGHEWKSGDRFTLEGTVEHADNGYVTLSVGPRKMTYGFHYVDFEDAKLIQPAAPEPQKLDTTKPVRSIWSGNTGRIVGRTIDGKKLVFEHDLGGMCIGPESDFENIPEPKRTYEQIVELVPFSDGIRIVKPGNPFKFVGIKSRAKISYVEGEGWSIEEES